MRHQSTQIAVLGAVHSQLPCILLLQAGVVLAKRVVVDTAHTVPAGTVVSLVQHSRGGSTGSEEEEEWPGAGAHAGGVHCSSQAAGVYSISVL